MQTYDNEHKAVEGRYKFKDGKSERLYCPSTAEKGITAHEKLNDLLACPDRMNMPSVFILDADKKHRDKVLDQWIKANNIGVNIAPGDEYPIDQEQHTRMAVEIRIGTETTLLKSMQQMVSNFSGPFEFGTRTQALCEYAIEQQMKCLRLYRPIMIIRDYENILNVKRRKERDLFAIILKGYYNALHCPFIITGNQDGANALNISEQYSWRFLSDVVDFDYWREEGCSSV